jgi:transposase
MASLRRIDDPRHLWTACNLYRAQRRRLERLASRERDGELRQRYRIVLALDKRLSPTAIHAILGAARSTIYRVARKFANDGEDGLRDCRYERTPVKVTEVYVERLEALIYTSPRQHGWQRSTWTCELLARQLAIETGISVHRTHLWRLLAGAGMRWGRPRPVPTRAISSLAKARRANWLRRFVDDLPPDETAVYEDEVDIHLNPKIGPCWMPRGVQFEVETPGKNQKRYVFGGGNPKTGHVVWMVAERKNSATFIQWLKCLRSAYRRYRVIHVVLDNYVIHKSKKTLAAVARMHGIVLHFLVPYSPEHNPIERLWGELHANVTRNHQCKDMDKLMHQVGRFLDDATPYPGSRPWLMAASL